jgi:flavin reductase (DIM6/NTAB) family NADH-FMN oxidoreductase RutF
MHVPIEPSILYFGTPVILLSTLNEDGTPNVAPMSSAWWLGWNCMLGLGSSSQTAKNLLREKECVINLPSVAQAGAVNRLAKLTGADPVPPHKIAMGYRHMKNKLRVSGLTASASDVVRALRINECPVQLEAVLETAQPFGNGPNQAPGCWAFEVRIVRAHTEENLVMEGTTNHVDPDKWRPLIMNFCRFYGLGDQVHSSTLAEIPEELYRPAPQMAR